MSETAFTHTITVKPGDKVIIRCPGMDAMAGQEKYLLFETREEKLTILFPALDT